MSLYPKMEVLSEKLPPVEALDGDELVFVLDDPAGSPTPKVATTQQIADLGGGGGAGYLEYVADIQLFSEPSVYQVYANTLGTPVLSHPSPGRFRFTLAGAFVSAKTIAFVTSAFYDFANSAPRFVHVDIATYNQDYIEIVCTDLTGAFTDAVNKIVQLVVHVYP